MFFQNLKIVTQSTHDDHKSMLEQLSEIRMQRTKNNRRLLERRKVHSSCVMSCVAWVYMYVRMERKDIGNESENDLDGNGNGNVVEVEEEDGKRRRSRL